jgi:hypothetical protein
MSSMTHSPRRRRRALLAFTAATFSLACLHEVPETGLPLYLNGQSAPNGASARLPREQIAQVTGPIEKIDDRDLTGQSGWFDLLPGCHVVELDRRIVADGYALSGARYWTGQFSRTTYSLQMKAGARYVIQRQIYSDGNSTRVILSAREEEAGGAITDLSPAKSGEEIAACRSERADGAPRRGARDGEPSSLVGAAPAQ